MIQALHAILGGAKNEENRNTKVTMLYGSKFAEDILGQELLNKWAEDYPDSLQLIHVLSDEPADSEWKGARGFINKALIETNFPPPSSKDKLLVFVCGPPPMYNALCGPREEKDVTGLLGEMGYKTEQVFKF